MNPDSDATARRAQRREVARRFHPDLGGSTEEFVAAMAALDSVTTNPPADGGDNAPNVTVVRRGPVRSLVRDAVRSGRMLARTARTTLPRRFPGSRRYGRL